MRWVRNVETNPTVILHSHSPVTLVMNFEHDPCFYHFTSLFDVTLSALDQSVVQHEECGLVGAVALKRALLISSKTIASTCPPTTCRMNEKAHEFLNPAHTKNMNVMINSRICVMVFKRYALVYTRDKHQRLSTRILN